MRDIRLASVRWVGGLLLVAVALIAGHVVRQLAVPSVTGTAQDDLRRESPQHGAVGLRVRTVNDLDVYEDTLHRYTLLVDTGRWTAWRPSDSTLRRGVVLALRTKGLAGSNDVGPGPHGKRLLVRRFPLSRQPSDQDLQSEFVAAFTADSRPASLLWREIPIRSPAGRELPRARLTTSVGRCERDPEEATWCCGLLALIEGSAHGGDGQASLFVLEAWAWESEELSAAVAEQELESLVRFGFHPWL